MSTYPFRRVDLDPGEVLALPERLGAHRANELTVGTRLRTIGATSAVGHRRPPEASLELVVTGLVGVVETVKHQAESQIASTIVVALVRSDAQGSTYPWQSRVPRKMS